MKVKIVVTDACIFIDLYDLGLVSLFFNLDLEIHTTTAVFFELYEEQQQALKAYQTAGRLTIHSLKEEDFLQIHAESYPKSLSYTDKSVLYIANKFDACVLSSDKTVRNCAKNKDIEYHGMIWIFDKLVESNNLQKKDAVQKLRLLIESNFIFQNNKPLVDEIQKRFKMWS